MDAIILVGGQGTRLRSVISDKPKPLAPIDGVPFLDYLLNQIENKVSRIILAVGYMGDQVANLYRDRCLISMEKTPLGTGGAVCKALELVEGERFWVLNGDSYFDISFDEMEKCEGDLIMACRHVDDVSRYGSVVIDKDAIISFQEKQESLGSGWINGGIYLMGKKLFKDKSTQSPFSLEVDFFPTLLLSDKKVIAYPGSGSFIDIGTPQSYHRAYEVLL